MMFLMSIVALATGIKHFSKLGHFKILLLVPIAEIAIDIRDILLTIARWTHYTPIVSIARFLVQMPNAMSEAYNIIEFISIQLFLSNTFKKELYKKLCLIFAVIFPIIFLFISIKFSTPKFAGSFSFTISSFVEIPTLLLFFSELVIDDSNAFYHKNPNFIMTSGIFVTLSVTFPTYMLLQFTQQNEHLIINSFMALNFFCYSYFFFTMIKAFKCQAALKK